MKVKADYLSPRAIPRARGRYVIRITERGTYITSWPKRRTTKYDPYEFYKRQEFANAAYAAANPEPFQFETAINLTRGTEQVPRDLLTMAAYGRAYRITGPDGLEWISFRNVTPNAQLVLDLVTQEIGSLLVRDEIGWIGIPRGNEGDVLIMRDGMPTWEQVPWGPGPGPGPGVPWTPEQIQADLLFWYSAKNVENFELDGNEVTKWFDYTPTGFDLTPQFDPASRAIREQVADFGNLNAVKYNGTSSSYVCGAGAALNQPWTFACMFRTGPTVQELETLVSCNFPGGNHLSLKWSGTSNLPHAFCGSVATRRNSVLLASTCYLDVTLIDGASSYSTFNGSNPDPASYNPGTAQYNSPFFGPPSGWGYFSGHYAEMLGIKRALTADELAKLQGYLAWEWGREVDLPADHPYKDAAPTI